MSKPLSSMSRVIALVFALCGALAALPAPARGEASPDEAVDKVTQMNKDAVTAYQAKKFDEARKILKDALDFAASSGLDTHPITARTHIHMGIVIIGGFKQRDLGVKQFKKALEIQPDIGLTKALITPELQEAFAEAKPGGTGGPAVAEGKEPSSAPAPTETAGGGEASGGLLHDPVTEGRQGSAISITVGVPKGLSFDKIILAYRPDGAVDFLGREMKEVGGGRYSAEIPTTATSGGAVAYYIEAEDGEGAPVAASGSVDSPIVIRLSGVGAPVVAKEEGGDDDEEDDEEPEYRYLVGMAVGVGFGWATGEGDTNADRTINPAGLARSDVIQFAPEFGYWWTDSLMLSVQLRYQYVSGPTDIHVMEGTGERVYHTANYALAGFAKATWLYGEGDFHPFFSLGAGLGRIRHVVSFENQLPAACGPNRNEVCKDTIGAGPVLLGPGAGLMYDIGDRASLVLQLNSVLGFPTFTAHLDANLGVAVNF